MAYNEQVCTERHDRIDARLECVEADVEVLKKSDAINSTEIKNLCKNLSNLTGAIWGLVVAVIGALGGFFVWFIQNK